MSIRAHSTIAALSVLATAVAAAQPQVVTKAAPEPTQAPKAFAAPAGPDAEALLLSDRYTLRADGSVVHEHAHRIRVNSSLAINRDFGESRTVWDPAHETFEVLHNRTVLPSGETVPGPDNALVDELPPEVHANPLWSRLRRKVVVHTALEPGAVIEAAWRITRAAARPAAMTVAEPLAATFPIAERIVEVEVPSGVDLLVSVDRGPDAPQADCATTEAGRTCRWRLERVAALPGEPGTPPRAEIEPFALAAAGAATERGWAAAELERRWSAAGPAPAGALAAARKAADAEPDRERALLAALGALGDAVNVSRRLAPSMTRWSMHELGEVWRSGWASPLEMAALGARVLGELGYDARPGVLLAGPQAGRAPGFTLHDDAVVVVRFGDGDLRLYDPREPAAERPIERSMDRAHVIAPGAAVNLGAFAAPWRRRLVASLTVGESGAVKGELSLTTASAATPHTTLVRDPQKLAERLAGGLVGGAKVTSTRTTRLERGAAALAASFEGALPDKSDRGLVAIALAGVAGGVTEELPPLPGAGRLSPIALPGPGDEELEVTLTLPAGWAVAALPVDVRAANDLGEVVVSSTVDERRVTVRRRITLAANVAPPADAARVRELLAAWSSPASRVLLLRPPVAK